MDTFLLTVTCRGNIVLVSSSVEQHLGHCRVSIIVYGMFAAQKSRTLNENIYIREIPQARAARENYCIFHAIITYTTRRET